MAGATEPLAGPGLDFDVPTGLALLLTLTAFVSASAVVYSRVWHPLAHIPGPFLGSITPLYQCWLYIRGNEHLVHRLLHDKYGPLVRLGPNAVIFNDPTLLPAVYHLKADKTDFYAPNFGASTTFTMRSHNDHVAAKRKIAHAYSMTSIKQYEAKMDKRITEVKKALLELTAEDSTPISVRQWADWLSFDVISDIAFGEPIGFVEGREDVRGLLKAFNHSSQYLEVLARLPQLSWYIRNTRLGRSVFMAKSTDKAGVGVLMAERDRIYQRHVLEKDCGDANRADLLFKFMSAKEKDGSPVQAEDVKSEALLAMVAGSGSTADELIYAIMNITRSSVCLHQVATEVREAISATNSSSGVAAYDDICKLPFLNACIRESFRFQTGPAQFPRVVDGHGITAAGRHIPAGTHMSTSRYILSRCKELYGDDVDEYRPQRWLEFTKEQLAVVEKYDFQWGYGARTCVGKHIAIMQILKTVFELFRTFTVEMDEHENETIRLTAREAKSE